MSPRTYTHALIALAVAVMAVSVWFTGRAQRDTVSDSFRQSETVGQLLTGMLNQETGLRGYLTTGRGEFLEPYLEGRDQLSSVTVATEARLPADDVVGRTMLMRLSRIARAWHVNAAQAIEAKRSGTARPVLHEILERKAFMDRFRATHKQLHQHIDARRDARIAGAANLSVLLVIGLSVLFTVGGWLTFGRRNAARARRRRDELDQRERQAAFAHALQFLSEEQAAHELIKRHLEESLPGADVTILRRSDRAGRLDALAAVDPGARVTAPRRLVTSTPLLVQGDAIGSVLVEHDRPLGDLCRQYV
jgi:CHASE3 domain sensor protein